MTECLSVCPRHVVPCTAQHVHILHSHGQPVGPLMMTHYWMDGKAVRSDL